MKQMKKKGLFNVRALNVRSLFQLLSTFFHFNYAIFWIVCISGNATFSMNPFWY